ncbi:MAG: pyroglutamyl-peptidase I [Proteobacteria bacterium]|nr:pyroglutamyl-peptidase I [Pseudomonadota bacterium]
MLSVSGITGSHYSRLMYGSDKIISSRTVLLTGFGPFPGIPVNASAELVRVIAPVARRVFPAFPFIAAVLPTEWRRAPELVAALQDRFQPRLALHIGVATGAQNIRLETCAENVCRDALDAAGLLPVAASLCADGPPKRRANIDVGAIANVLRAHGTQCAISDNAGGYLCNAVLYQSLARAEARGCGAVGFVHIPADLGLAGAITMDDALTAILAVIGTALGGTDAMAGTPATAQI